MAKNGIDNKSRKNSRPVDATEAKRDEVRVVFDDTTNDILEWLNSFKESHELGRNAAAKMVLRKAYNNREKLNF